MKKTLITSLLLTFCAAFAHAQLTATWVQGPDGKLIQVWKDSSVEQPAKPKMQKAVPAPKNYMEAYAKLFAKGKKPTENELRGSFAGYMAIATQPEKLMGAVFLGITYQGEDMLSILVREHKTASHYLAKTHLDILELFEKVYSDEIGTFDFLGDDAAAWWPNGMKITFRKTEDGKLIAREVDDNGKALTYRLFTKELPY